MATSCRITVSWRALLACRIPDNAPALAARRTAAWSASRSAALVSRQLGRTSITRSAASNATGFG